MIATPAAALPATLTAWHDPLVEAHGFGPRSPYVEGIWAGILGPSAVLCYRRLGPLVELRQGDIDVDVVDLAVSLGLGEGIGRHYWWTGGIPGMVNGSDETTVCVDQRRAPLSHGGPVR